MLSVYRITLCSICAMVLLVHIIAFMCAILLNEIDILLNEVYKPIVTIHLINICHTAYIDISII